jgi:hypothetical protein
MTGVCVWKWRIPYEVDFALDMPEGAEILTVQTQYQGTSDEQGALWALVDPTATPQKRLFRLVGTGVRGDRPGPYVGTFQLTGGSLVLHVFEARREQEANIARAAPVASYSVPDAVFPAPPAPGYQGAGFRS